MPADKLVDTNGAGDAFVGGFLSQLVRRMRGMLCSCGAHAVWLAVFGSGGLAWLLLGPLWTASSLAPNRHGQQC